MRLILYVFIKESGTRGRKAVERLCIGISAAVHAFRHDIQVMVLCRRRVQALLSKCGYLGIKCLKGSLHEGR
jgi:hypothetical protein